MENENVIFGRHTNRADGKSGYGELDEGDRPSEIYPGVTEKGVEKARQLAHEQYGEVLKKMAPGGILFIGGSSEEGRTKDTAEIVGDELAEIHKQDSGILVVTRKEIEKMIEDSKEKSGKALEEIKKIIDENLDKKIVIDYPLFLKELSLRPHFRDKSGKHTAYSQELLKRHEFDEEKGALDMFKNESRLEKDGEILQIPTAQKMAEAHIRSIERLKEFSQTIAPGRQINLGIVGHGWQLDALALFYANQGRVDAEGLKEKFKNEFIQQAEAGWVEISGDKTILHYKEKVFENKINFKHVRRI